MVSEKEGKDFFKTGTVKNDLNLPPSGLGDKGNLVK